MRKAAWLLSLTSICAAIFAAPGAHAAPVLRVQISQHGDMAWIGNTSAQSCDPGARAPVVGTVGACGANTGDSAADLFWRADDLVGGDATAELTHTAATARSTAVLDIPPGATLTYARLYWGAQLGADTPDQVVTIERPPGFSSDVTADTSYSVLKVGFPGVYWYESTADVTDLVKAQGEGAYRVSGIDSVDVNNFQSDDPFVGWSLIVFYELVSDPQRNLALFDGLDFVNAGNPAVASLTGFLVPIAGFDAKLGVLAYEGDIVFAGDALVFNGNVLPDDGVNLANNFFNASRSWLGAPVSVAGDLPQMDGLAQSMSGMDLDVVNVTPFVAAGQTTATIQATSAGDTYVLGAFATSISTYQPEFSTTQKSILDLNGGSFVRGDILEYTIQVNNSGNDAAVNTVLTDPLPAGVSYVPESIEVIFGDNLGLKTDAPGDDQAEYDPLTRTVTIRLGAGATAVQGGSIAIDGSTTVTFQVTIDPEAVGDVANQATITAEGLQGNPVTNYPSGSTNPDTPTTFTIAECDDNTDCIDPKPVCDMDPTPHVCVQCLADSDCGAEDSGLVCDVALTTCINGCRGTDGNGCPPGQACTSQTDTIGGCVAVVDGGAADAAVPVDGSTDADGGVGGADGVGGVGGAAGEGGGAGEGGTAGEGGGAGEGGAAGSPAGPTGSIQGGGCACTTVGSRSAVPPAIALLFGALTLAGFSRRRKVIVRSLSQRQ